MTIFIFVITINSWLNKTTKAQLILFADIKQRLQGATNIVEYLNAGGVVEVRYTTHFLSFLLGFDTNIVHFKHEFLGDVVDALEAGIKNSNSKVS